MVTNRDSLMLKLVEENGYSSKAESNGERPNEHFSRGMKIYFIGISFYLFIELLWITEFYWKMVSSDTDNKFLVKY